MKLLGNTKFLEKKLKEENKRNNFKQLKFKKVF